MHIGKELQARMIKTIHGYPDPSSMLKRAFVCASVLLVSAFSPYAKAHTVAPEVVLAPAQQRVINAGIARLRLSGERQIAREWGNAKQIAEFICRPAASPALARELKGVDRIFLGTDVRDSLRLVSRSELTGTGQARVGGGWQAFSFECWMDPDTAKVVRFTVTMSK
jgi:hypothetical protein